MSSSDQLVAKVDGISKCYRIYRRPVDRLLNVVFPFIERHEDHWALQNIDFHVDRGEAIGVVGRNGSGKSTLLQILAGTLDATRGEYEVRGRVAALLELGAGFNPEFTGRQNVELSATLFGIGRDELAVKYESIVEFSGLEEFIDRPVKTYSSGMYMRLAFSVVAHIDADVLIIDEALAVGDAFFVRKCMRFLKEFKVNGSLILVSHDTGSVMNLCDRALWLDQGVIRASGDPKTVCEDYLADKYAEEMGIVRQASPPAETKTAPSRPEVPVPVLNERGEQSFIGVWFDESASRFGVGGARVVDVQILDRDSQPVDLLQGGEQVIVKVRCSCDQGIDHPIVGFSIKDRLGQHLLGDNTGSWGEGKFAQNVPGGSTITTRFSFSMPLLLSGQYTICAAIASGTLDDHVQHDWVHDALVFTVHSSSLAGVLVGVPMQDIQVDVEPPG